LGCVPIIHKNTPSARLPFLIHSSIPHPTMSETSPPPSRRFQPVPVEEMVKRVRRFAVEPVETSYHSSTRQEKRDDDVSKQPFAGKRRFPPTPAETTSFKSTKLLPPREPNPISIPTSPPPEEIPKPRRRFAPQLIETLKRSKKAGDSRPATLPTDKVRIDTNNFYSFYIC
jgi:hypothetical protein